MKVILKVTINNYLQLGQRNYHNVNFYATGGQNWHSVCAENSVGKKAFTEILRVTGKRYCPQKCH
jgi:hypothetical protein